MSGTTATAAVVVGWELLVANVGDSCAYLDTGAEVLLARPTATRRVTGAVSVLGLQLSLTHSGTLASMILKDCSPS